MSAPRTRVAVIGGGRSCEHEVSLDSAASVADALDPSAYDVVALTIDPHGTWLDAGGRPIGLAGAAHALRGCDVVLPVVHGPHGEDGTLAALCELAGLPYVGSGVSAGALAMHKWVTKLVADAVGVMTAPGVLLTAATAPTYLWTHPVVVKPVAAGSSHGVSLVERPEHLDEALAAALAVDDRVLVEDLLVGREVDIAVIARPDGSRLLSPPLEIVVDGLFDHDAKYGGTADFRIPASLTEAEGKAVADAALAVFDALGCRGVARVDFFLTDAGVVLNEVNTMPGFTAHSQVPRMYAAAGLDYPDLLDLLVRDALVDSRATAMSCG
jgi:D-alanine-D-alanine ligase